MLRKTSNNQKPNSSCILDDESEDAHLSDRAHYASDNQPYFSQNPQEHASPEALVTLHCMRQSLNGN